MEVEYKAEVRDLNGEILGTVDHLVRDTWTGEISKFVVRREAPANDLFLSSEDVSQVTKDTVRLNVSAEELNQR